MVRKNGFIAAALWFFTAFFLVKRRHVLMECLVLLISNVLLTGRLWKESEAHHETRVFRKDSV